MEFGRENIPAELRKRRQWVNHDTAKVPYTPGTERRAASTDSETWKSFEEAAADGRGLGFVFTSGDPYTGVDLDKCRDPKTGAVEPWARQIVEDLGGYVEASPSGTGLHIIVKGKLPIGNNRRVRVEAYSSERYFSITGTGSGSGSRRGRRRSKSSTKSTCTTALNRPETPEAAKVLPTNRSSKSSCTSRTVRGGHSSPATSRDTRATATLTKPS
jgi:putative DNA primase/helicase